MTNDLALELYKTRRKQIIYKIMICCASVGVMVALALCVLAGNNIINKLAGEIVGIVIAAVSLICLIISAGFKGTWMPLISYGQTSKLIVKKINLRAINGENNSAILYNDENVTICSKKTEMNNTIVVGILNIKDNFDMGQYSRMLQKMHNSLPRKYKLSFLIFLNCERKISHLNKLLRKGALYDGYVCTAQAVCTYFAESKRFIQSVPSHSKSTQLYYDELQKVIDEITNKI